MNKDAANALRIVLRRAAPFVAATLIAVTALADDGKQRYVAGNGEDHGDCLNRFRPCRTLSYAIGTAGKADRILAAEGDYAIRSSNDLLNVLSVRGRLAGGYSAYSAYSERNAIAKTTLIGVPPEFRERLESAGFAVIVDSKGIAAEETARMRKISAQVLASEKSQSAAPCVGNVSNGFGCQSVGLFAHLAFADMQPASTRGNDVWGFTDLNTRREYALMGLNNGIAVVDITNPQSPEQIGSTIGSDTTWRDITVYQRYDTAARRWRAYAYATADNVQDFLIVLDLSALPNGIERVSYDSDFRAAHTNYLINADYMYGIATTADTPELGIAGGTTNSGNHRIYSLATPRAPSLLSVATAGYAHDLGSLAITDARKNTQCVNAQSRPYCQVLTDFNEDTVDVWDVTVPGSQQLLATVRYPNAGYVHSGFWTEDGRYLFVHDELDERNFGLHTTIRVFDMSNLRAPALAGTWVGPGTSIDHNGATRGNRYYVSNYSEGLLVLDITNPAVPVRVGNFDTYPASAETGFVGAWSVYPFFESGTVAIGDINSGLYLLQNDTLASPAGKLTLTSNEVSGVEGQTVTLSVARNGGSAGAVSVQFDLLYASAGADDVALATQQLTWADGDAQPKNVTLTLANDAQDEDMELAIVRLRNPQGGATISLPEVARVNIADVGSRTRLALLD
ncbi:MAG TPA: choice-of-anchor B family protein, partial [Povalibacter sp.]|nr:choice-of-anchor B family protein [Povalibacter sp.]